MNNKVLELINVEKVYKRGETELKVLKNINFTIYEGDYIAVMGPSGSGKSTLLNLMGLLDKPTSGKVIFNDKEVSKYTDKAISKLRNQYIGFIFQNFNLFSQLTVKSNIEVPMLYKGIPKRESGKKAIDLSRLVMMEERLYHRPTQLSGGEMQRVAIARALANDPQLLLADEPTGNLDTKTGEEILNIFDSLAKQGRTLVVVTHDQNIANRTKKIVHLLDGEIKDIEEKKYI